MESASTLRLRRTMGILGICMPPILWICGLITKSYMMSISNTHYEPISLVFEGTVVAVAYFLLTYSGYDIGDRICTIIGGVSALLLSYFPTKAITELGYIDTYNLFGIPSKVTNWFHVISALIFFFSLSYMSVFRFTKTAGSKSEMTKEKVIRNKIYIAMGILMILTILIGGAIDWIIKLVYAKRGITNYYEIYGLKTGPLFYGEALGLICFGVSWLIKGETLFKDK